MQNEKLVSVILPVHNSDKYLQIAIQSVLDQTYKNFEFLILLSTTSNKESVDIINSFTDPRIRRVSQVVGANLPKALNLGIDESKGDYIARMDADDICLPQRLEKEVKFMEANPTIGMCGSWYQSFGRDGKFVNKLPTSPEDIKANLLFRTTFAHPTVMFRAEPLKRLGLCYNGNLSWGEDYEMWSRCMDAFPLANVPEVLLHYRIHDNSASQVFRKETKDTADLVRERLLAKINLTPSEEERRLHNTIRPEESESIEEFISKEEVWFKKILAANLTTKFYAQDSLIKILYGQWKTLCGINAKGGIKVWKKFISSPLYTGYKGNRSIDNLKVLIKSIVASR